MGQRQQVRRASQPRPARAASTTTRSARESSSGPIPGGITLTRRQVKRAGGLAGIAISLALFVIGWVMRAILDGTVGNVVWFSLTMVAFPVMPILGIPAAGGSGRIMVAVAISAALWWFLGQLAAAKVSSKPIVGWREWSREFIFFSTGIIAGTIGGITLAAYLLGVL